MAVPKFRDVMKAFLEALSNKEVLDLEIIRKKTANILALSEEDLQEMIPNGSTHTRFRDRISWSSTYLKKAMLVCSPTRGTYQITERGIKALHDKPDNLLKYLEQFDEYRQFKSYHKSHDGQVEVNDESIQFQSQNQDITPDEMIAYAQNVYELEIKDELLRKLQEIDPYKFEKLIIMLMEKMNYGVGSLTPKSHDGGIDGVIDEDELGLDKIYLQAKRYSDNNRVNEKEMRDFVGALATKPFNKAVFVTTSFFDQKAKQTAKDALGKNIRLIEGDELIALMIKHNIGVQTKQLIELKQLDNDFFYEE